MIHNPSIETLVTHGLAHIEPTDAGAVQKLLMQVGRTAELAHLSDARLIALARWEIGPLVKGDAALVFEEMVRRLESKGTP